jgi:Fe-S-cluster-containing dehydrogenase component/CRP-like cAMP-binding protein
MPPASTILDRPQRWDASFDPEMSDAAVDRLLATAPFREMRPEAFPKRMALRDILKNDTRLRRFRDGEIVVREGDHGTSAFMILTGSVRVVISPDLPASMLGRRESRKRSLFRVLGQLWSGNREPESCKKSQLSLDAGLGSRRDAGDEVRVFLQDIPRVLDRHKTAIIESGEFFGEIAALSRMPRTATVFAAGDAELLEIRWQGLRDLMRYDDKLRRHIDKIYRERALETYLREQPVFRHLADADLQKVMAQVEFNTYGDYDWSGEYKRLAQSGSAGPPIQEPVIASEGDYPNGVVLIRAGFGRVSQKFGHGHRTLNYLGSGQSYGFREIAHNWRNPSAPVPLQHTLRVIGYTHVLVIPTKVMEEVVLPKLGRGLLPPPVVPRKGVDAVDAREDIGAKIGADVLEFLTENRFFNGKATMLIDLDRCTRCDDCVRACSTAHDNNPRFLRNGPTNGRIMVANACMHCADPVCMIGCPTGAIHRDDAGGEVVINPATCIGCRACYTNCPYDAIRMVEIRDETGVIVVDDGMRAISKATKCDLCNEQPGGPACARACPHDALVRMDMTDLDRFARWLKR